MLYRIAGLAMTIGAIAGEDEADTATGTIRQAYLAAYWEPQNWTEWLDIAAAIVLWPVVIVVSAVLFTGWNGARVAGATGRSHLRQFGDQLSLAVTRGILPPWYYVFELYRPGTRRRLADFLGRAETKEGVYRLLAARRGASSPLADKFAFARVCRAASLPTPEILAVARDGALEERPGVLPECDLFMKPVRASGGKGAERWDWTGGGRYRISDTCLGDASAVLDRLAARSITRPMILQPRLTNAAELSGLSNGALATVRVLTCLDETDRPEIVGAVLRMAIGDNHTVDNLHAGGIAAGVSLSSGRLGLATNLGMDVQLGWLARHPVSGAAIEGSMLPQWEAVQALALRAHAAFSDHLLIGWDIAPTDAGVVLIEGNHGPDLDIMQRVTLEPLGSARLGVLLAHHLARSSSV